MKRVVQTGGKVEGTEEMGCASGDIENSNSAVGKDEQTLKVGLETNDVSTAVDEGKILKKGNSDSMSSKISDMRETASEPECSTSVKDGQNLSTESQVDAECNIESERSVKVVDQQEVLKIAEMEECEEMELMENACGSLSSEFVRFSNLSALKNLTTGNRIPQEVLKMAEMEEECEDACGSSSSEFVRFTNASAFKYLTTRKELRTLEDCLETFRMFPRLSQLDESLKKVRKYKNTEAEHEEECKLLDKDLLELTREYHPDDVSRRGGSEKEMSRAKDLQTALNATRMVLKTLTQIFLEDLDIKRQYEFYTKLDMNLLINEDEVEVLFKIGLISEIKQESILGNTRGFINSCKMSIDFFSESTQYFLKLRWLAFDFLERCNIDYRKLNAKFEEAESRCKIEKLHNISPTIHKVKRDCSIQLRHLEALLELWKRPLGEPFQMYNSTLPVDEYLGLPFVCYTSVILAFSVMVKLASDEDEGGSSFSLPTVFKSLFGKSQNSFVDFDVVNNDISVLYGDHEDIVVLYQLALCYGGNKKCAGLLKNRFGWQRTVKEIVKRQFFETLKTVLLDLEGRFKADDYPVEAPKIHPLKGLILFGELTDMLQKIGKKSRTMDTDIQDIQEIRKKKEYVNKRLDAVLENEDGVRSRLEKYSSASQFDSPI